MVGFVLLKNNIFLFFKKNIFASNNITNLVAIS